MLEAEEDDQGTKVQATATVGIAAVLTRCLHVACADSGGSSKHNSSLHGRHSSLIRLTS